MRSRQLALCALACAGCSTATQVDLVKGLAKQPVSLESGPEPDMPDATYRWDLVEKPARSRVTGVSGGVSATFVPDVRGVYRIDRWVMDGVSDDFTDEFVVTVAGIPPVAVIKRLPMEVVVGTPVPVDATSSTSAEGLSLSSQWRISLRPEGSNAVLADDRATVTSFVPDASGGYQVQLLVFDGELWSDPATTGTVAP